MVKHALAVAFVVSLSVPNSASAEESGKGADDTFLDGLDWQVMASGFYLFNAHRVAGPYNNLNYPYTGYMGFGLNFAGGDVSYTGRSLRSPSASAGARPHLS